MNEKLESKVDEHDRMLIEMQTILKGMAESQNRMAENIGNMAQAISKIDLWLEKITNLEGNTKESFKRSYRVISDLEDKLSKDIKSIDISATVSVKDLEDKVDEGFKDLEVARFFSKYPKLLLLVVVGFCVLNIEPIRKIIFGG